MVKSTKWHSTMVRIVMHVSNGGLIPLFSDTFDTKYRAKNFTDSDTNTNPYSYIVACISHQMSYLPLGI